MRIPSKAKRKPWEWHVWFAWRPVRIPDDVYTDGQWVWWEPVLRKIEHSYAGSYSSYKPLDNIP